VLGDDIAGADLLEARGVVELVGQRRQRLAAQRVAVFGLSVAFGRWVYRHVWPPRTCAKGNRAH
jgi:hypothetical protein